MAASAISLRRSTRTATTTMRRATAPTAIDDVRTVQRSRSVSSLSSLSTTPSDQDDNPRPTKRARVRGPETAPSNNVPPQKKPRQKKQAAIEHVPDDFMVRAVNPWKIGPHVSSAGGVENAIINAASVGANAFAIFLKSQRKWESNALKDESIAKFKERMKAFGYSPSHVLPHGSYLVNLGNPDSDKREKSFACFLDDLKRCEQLGLHLYNFHPGSTVGASTVEESLSLIAECINRAHEETNSVVIVLENMAGSGNVIGSRFSELGQIIREVNNKARVGVCLDTCHMYAAGYDITTREGWQKTMEEFDREVGVEYLRGMHINDSKAALGSKKDRHENIGLGHLGLRAFVHILADPRTRDIPLILETPAYDVPTGSTAAARDRLATEGMSVWRTEVAVLNRLSGRGGDEDSQIQVTEDELEDGRKEIEDAVNKASKLRDGKGKKVDKTGKTKKKAKRKKSAPEDDEDEESCCSSER
ncbi:AP endonuclease [Cubamyces sp. BRFM 1775]|nr:AP endonuclease [Cubamyces sp. BRFM 1775]